MTRRTWRDLPVDETITLYRNGATISGLARHHNINRIAIRRFLAHHKLPPRSRSEALRLRVMPPGPAQSRIPVPAARRAYTRGESAAKLGAQYGTSGTVVRVVLHRAGVPIRPAGRPDVSTDRIVELYRDGMSGPRIGRLLQVTSNTVYSRLESAGVQRRAGWETRRLAREQHAA